MNRTMTIVLLVAAGATLPAAQPAESDVVKAFDRRAQEYVELHRRSEGPIPPRVASRDMAEVEKLMAAVRARIRSSGIPKQGHLLTPDMNLLLRKRIAAVLTKADLVEIDEDVIEHSPPDMAPLRFYEVLPEDAPFIPIPPVLFKTFPTLAPELRYMILARALVIWDEHANLVVDIGPKLFDPATYGSSNE